MSLAATLILAGLTDQWKLSSNSIMKTPDGLFFAPGVRFKDLDVENSSALADALGVRARCWFLEPARCVAHASPFAAGIVIACFIDAMAEFQGVHIADCVREAVPGSKKIDPRRMKKTIADSFAEDVRHGLVHHARLNRGTEFSLDLEQPMAVLDSVLVVNPLLLLRAVEDAWDTTLARVRYDADVHRRVKERILRVFRADFDADQAWLVKAD